MKLPLFQIAPIVKQSIYFMGKLGMPPPPLFSCRIFCWGLLSRELEIFKISVGRRTENFLTAAGFHGYELSVLVKMHVTSMVKTFLKFQWKSAHFVVWNFIDVFLDFNAPFQVITWEIKMWEGLTNFWQFGKNP